MIPNDELQVLPCVKGKHAQKSKKSYASRVFLSHLPSFHPELSCNGPKTFVTVRLRARELDVLSF